MDGDKLENKVDIICCKQCDGYGIAKEFVDRTYCSEKCRKIGLARQSLVKSLTNVVKIQAVKRKSIGDPASSAVPVIETTTPNDTPTNLAIGPVLLDTSLDTNNAKVCNLFYHTSYNFTL